MAETYLAPIPARTPPRDIHTVEPEQMGEKRIWVHKKVSSPNLLIAYHVPETGSADYYPLTILSSILSGGRSSRLYSALVSEGQLALQVFAYMPESMDPSLFYIYGVCARGVNEDKLESAIYGELDKIIKEGVTEKELQKVKNQLLVSFYNSMETINGKADTIGTYEVFHGSYKKLFDAPKEYEKVTAADIQRVAAKYFKRSNRTVGILKNLEEK